MSRTPIRRTVVGVLALALAVTGLTACSSEKPAVDVSSSRSRGRSFFTLAVVSEPALGVARLATFPPPFWLVPSDAPDPPDDPQADIAVSKIADITITRLLCMKMPLCSLSAGSIPGPAISVQCSREESVRFSGG